MLVWCFTQPSFGAEISSAEDVQSDGLTCAKTKRGKKPRPRSKKRIKARKSRRQRQKQAVTVPVDVGIGPAAHFVTGPIQDDQQIHTGLKVSLAAIIDKELIEAQKHRIPKKFRAMAAKTNEVRFRPGILAFVPDTIFLSPQRDATQMWGANWRLAGIGGALGTAPRLGISLGLNVTYAFVGSERDELGDTHFLRPGLDGRIDAEFPLSDTVLISLGWTSFVYPPQEVGGPLLELGDMDRSIWHIGQAFLKLHFRIPYTVVI